MRPRLAGSTGSRAGGRRAGLDFPFATINIVLLLLFFFIVNGSIVGGNEHPVVAPSLAQATPGRLPRPLLVIGRTGELFLNDLPVARADLIGQAETVLKAAGGDRPPLNILADRSYSGEAFLVLVETIRAAGIPVRIVSIDTAKG